MVIVKLIKNKIIETIELRPWQNGRYHLLSILKPIFHCKLSSRWVPNANEMSTNNMKCTWPTQNFSIGSRWGFALGVTQILAFLHTNMLVYPTQNCGVGGLSQCEDLIVQAF